VSDWTEVGRGWVVKDKNGQEWTVTGKDGPLTTISAPGKPTFTREFTGEVTVISRPAPQDDPRVEEAVAKGLVAVKFGGIEVGKQGKDKRQPWATPVEFVDAGSLLAHMRIFHNTTSDDPSLAGLTREHATLHLPDQKADGLYEPHIHDPDYENR
jgi:hypothetical protein